MRKTKKTDYKKILSSALYNFRWDTSRFVVHHIDHNRENNSLENLVLIPKKMHAKYHLASNATRAITPKLFGNNIDVDNLVNNLSWINHFIDCKIDIAMLKSFQDDTIMALRFGLYTRTEILEFYASRIEYMAQKYE